MILIFHQDVLAKVRAFGASNQYKTTATLAENTSILFN